MGGDVLRLKDEGHREKAGLETGCGLPLRAGRDAAAWGEDQAKAEDHWEPRTVPLKAPTFNQGSARDFGLRKT